MLLAGLLDICKHRSHHRIVERIKHEEEGGGRIYHIGRSIRMQDAESAWSARSKEEFLAILSRGFAELHRELDATDFLEAEFAGDKKYSPLSAA